MKRIFITVFFIAVFAQHLSADIITGPSKKKDVGAVVGRIYLYLDKKWGDLEPGNYYTVDALIENIATKKQYKMVRCDKGYFYFINVPPGQYILRRLDFSYIKNDMIYYFTDFKVYRSDNGKSIEGINFGIQKNTITVLKTIFIYIKLMPDNRFNSYYNREGDTEHLINFFKSMDYHKKWTAFEFGEFEVE